MTNGPPPIINQTAWDIGRLAQRLMEEYYTHMAALHVAADPKAAALAPPIEPGQAVPVLRVPRDDGTYHIFHFSHFLDQVREPQLVEDFKRAWLASSLLTIGDALGDSHQYYDQAPGAEPEAELVRHLRNGVAHGNEFSMRGGVIEQNTGLPVPRTAGGYPLHCAPNAGREGLFAADRRAGEREGA
jgi:hypothetical protein